MGGTAGIVVGSESNGSATINVAIGTNSGSLISGTGGLVKGAAVQIALPDRPTKDDLARHLDGLRNTVRGRMVLVGEPRVVPVTFNDMEERYDDVEDRAVRKPQFGTS